MKKHYFFIMIMWLFILNACADINKPNLLNIQHISPKGRIQDKEYNKNIPVVDELLKMNKSVIPFLIGRLKSKTPLRPGTIDFWYYAEERHLALAILTDLFLDQTWKRTSLPNFCFGSIIESKKYPGMLACEIINEHFDDTKWKTLQQEWLAIWEKYKDRIQWDVEGNFFRIEGFELKNCE